jgi:hypothetical protein
LNARTSASQSRNRALFANVMLPFGPATKKLGAYIAAMARSSSPHRQRRVTPEELLDGHSPILAALSRSRRRIDVETPSRRFLVGASAANLTGKTAGASQNGTTGSDSQLVGYAA